MRTRTKLIEVLREAILESYKINCEYRMKDGCYRFDIIRNSKIFELTIYLKNISSAYLKYDPSVDRIQIPPLPSLHRTTQDRAFLLMGEKDEVFVAWTPFRYIHHSKYRSAYVFQENINRGAKRGYYATLDHENQIYVCTKGHFSELLEAYIRDTCAEEPEW